MLKQKALGILKQYWNYDSFRPMQWEIIDSVLHKTDTLALLTTGGGKSICFQVPAMMQEGLCLVVSPLVALMKDQVMQLRNRKIPSACIYSSMPKADVNKIIDGCIDGKVKFLYVSPERIQSKPFLNYLRQMQICMVAIDEAHCISQWGYDFRPSYLQIAAIRDAIDSCPFLALTATATPLVQKDILEKLELTQPKVFMSSYEKPNLSYSIIHCTNKVDRLIGILKKKQSSKLIYVNRRSSAEELYRILNDNNIHADYYHAGLSFKERMQKQERWIQSKSVMISTNAFGMGIDKSDVDMVIHFHFPNALEGYFQEVGRAGRNGERAYGIALVQPNDIKELENKKLEYPTLDEVRDTMILLYNFYNIPLEAGEYASYPFSFEAFCDKYQLQRSKTQLCLDILIENEWIAVEDMYFRPARIQLLYEQNELHEFYKAYPYLEQFVKQLIRTFEGIFTIERPVDLDYFARKNHYELKDVVSNLKQLESKDFLTYKPASNAPIIVFFESKQAKAKMALNHGLYIQRKEKYLNQLSAVIDFLNLKDTCRSVFLMQYFGEKTNRSCGQCDICLSKKENSNKDIYIEIRKNILEKMDKNIFFDLEFIKKINPKMDIKLIRKVIDRMLEISELEKGVGETFRKII